MAAPTECARFPPRGQLIDVGDRRLHLIAKGAGGPAVVVEQGARGPALSWLGLQSEIAGFTTVCLYDRAGNFWSEAVPGRRTLQSRVADLRAALTAAAIPPPYVLVWHSYGGFLIRLFARNHPEDVAGLVFVDAPHEYSSCRREGPVALFKIRADASGYGLRRPVWRASIDLSHRVEE